ncbi:MAG: Hsp33 family molecular chaperone HslO [Myxococcota bacterium]
MTESPGSRARRLYLERKTGPTQHFDEAPPLPQDTLWRGLSRGGEVRLLVVRATTSVQQVAERIHCNEETAQLLGEVVLAALLVRSTLNPEERIQVALRHHGPVGQVLVDVWETGGFRVHMRHPEAKRDEFGFLIGHGILEVTRSRVSAKRSHRSVVELEGERVDDFMMKYLLESEQVLSLLRVEVAVQNGVVQHAVGYLLQLMPGGTREHLKQIVENLQTLPLLSLGMTEGDPDGRAWAEQLMRGLPWDSCAREEVRFQCRCSEDRFLEILSTLPRHEIEELAAGTELLDISCDYCGKDYQIRPNQVRVLLDPPS